MRSRTFCSVSAIFLVLLSTSISIPQASAEEGLVERISATLSGLFDHASTRNDQESYSAAHQAAEDTIEANQRKQQYAGESWWGEGVQYLTRGYQILRAYLHPYREFAEAYVFKYLPDSVTAQLRPTKSTAENVADSISDYVRGAGAAAGDAASGVQKLVGNTKAEASDGAQSIVGAVAEQVMAAGRAARSAGDGAGAAANDNLQELSKRAEEAREGLKAATDAASSGAAQAADAAGNHITDAGEAVKAATGSQQRDSNVRSEL